MRRVDLLLTACLVLELATASYGFDGKRKGLVLGAGFGVAPAVSWNTRHTDFDNHESKHSEVRAGGAANILVGYAWRERDMIALEANGASMNSDYNNAVILQGYTGPVWYHYFPTRPNAFFSAAGIGLFSHRVEYKEHLGHIVNDPGLGWLGGIGFEFRRHCQVSVVVNGGNTSFSSNGAITFHHLNLEVLANFMAY